MSLRPLSDSHLASGLDTRARDWMVWKGWGKAGSVSLGKGQGLEPFDNTCQGLARTHSASSEWESLQPPLSPHLHIRQRAKWPNAGFNTKQTQWFTAINPSSDLCFCYCEEAASNITGCVLLSTFTASHYKCGITLNHTLISPATSKLFHKKYMLHQQLSSPAVSSSSAVSAPTTSYSRSGGSLDRWYRQRR